MRCVRCVVHNPQSSIDRGPTGAGSSHRPHTNRSVAVDYDVVIRGGTIYDGSGAPPYVGDLAIQGDTIAAVTPASAGRAGEDRGRTEIDARGLAVAPGFVNLMGKETTLFADGRAQSDIRQGVKLEVFGEGVSLGPLNDEMRAEVQRWRGLYRGQDSSTAPAVVPWRTLGEG